MAGQEAVAGIGTIAQEFAKGFREARGQRIQQAHQQRQEMEEHHDRLLKMIDTTDDPVIKNTLYNSALALNDKIEALYKQPEKAHAQQSKQQQQQQPGALHTLLGSLFGLGKKPQPTTGTEMRAQEPAIPTRIPQSPSPVAQGSYTFGSPSTMLGSAVDTKEPTPQGMPSVPDFGSNSGTGVQRPGGFQLPSSNPPMSERTPIGGSSTQIPSSADIKRQAIHDTSAGHFRDKTMEPIRAQEIAQQTVNSLLDTINKHIPQGMTFADASTHKEFGPDFQKAMDVVNQYASSGLIGPNYLKEWQAGRFADMRPGYQAPKRPDQKTFDDRVDEAYLNNASLTPDGKPKATNEDWALMNAHVQMLKDKEAAGQPLTTDEQMKKAWVEEEQKGIKNGPAAQQAKRYMSTFHPVQPPAPLQFLSPNQDTGRTEHVLYDRSGKEIARIPAPGTPFIQSRYQKEIQRMTPNTLFKADDPRRNDPQYMEKGPKEKVLSAKALIEAHLSHDPSITLELLQGILRSGSDMEPEDRKQLAEYVTRASKPADFH